MSNEDRKQLIELIKGGKVVVGEPHSNPFVNAVWCLVFSMVEHGITGSDPWWGEDFLAVKRMLEERGLNCDPAKLVEFC